ncbi:MAG: hypothetical protein K6C99_02240 [Lachnospiraceae bacterium]|nr:hypothetical protein [Lachnospiraceae bacterium]
MSFIAILLGMFTAASIALYIVSRILKKSNDLGNTEGKYYDFADSFVRINRRQDRVNMRQFRF